MTTDDKNYKFYDPFDNMSFTDDRCFLCGSYFSDEIIKTDEHIFPKWLCNRFNLWEHSLNLLNGTSIPYRSLTIPCCSECNGKYLQKIETEICENSLKGYDEFIKIDELKVFQWISKIFYGILFKELFLYTNRRNLEDGTIITPEHLKSYEMVFFFLQSIRMPFIFHNFVPWSVFIFKTLDYQDYKNFNYHDGIAPLTFSIRFADIGIIVCLQDNGSIKELLGDGFDKYNQIELSFFQFDEISAIVHYKALLLNRVPEYIIWMPEKEFDPVNVVTLPLGGLSDKPIFDEWDVGKFVSILHSYWSIYGINYEQILPDPNRKEHLTFLTNEEGVLKQFDKNNNIFKLISPQID